jgi:pSer/pThr/pTyr-binding forkhead associated (FHA) protein
MSKAAPRSRPVPSGLEGGWALQAAGRKAPRIVLGETELARDFGIVVGRHSALCDRTIDDGTLSRRHCRFSAHGGQLFVEDLNSLNGTQVGGEDVPPFVPVPLPEDQTVTLGRLTLRVHRIGEERGR